MRACQKPKRYRHRTSTAQIATAHFYSRSSAIRHQIGRRLLTWCVLRLCVSDGIMMNEQPPAAAAGGGVLHGSDAQTDQSSLLRNICDQFTSLQGQLCKRPHEALEFLLRKTKESPMSASRVEIAKGALSDLSTSIEAYKSAVSRVKGLALLEGNLKLFALRPPANNNTKSHEKKAQVGAESSDTTSPSSSAAAGGGGGAVNPDPHLFVQRLCGLPPELHHTLAGWMGAEGKEAATFAQTSNTLIRTSHADSSAIETAVTSVIDDLIERKGLTGVIDYQPLRQSTSRRRVFRLIRLRHVLELGGDWAGSVPLLRLAKNCRRIQQLPLQLDEGDVGCAGSQADIDSRAASMRQYGLFGHLLGWGLRRVEGVEWLGGTRVRVYTQEPADHRNTFWSVPEDYRDTFDPNDPACDFLGLAHRSFRELVAKCFLVRLQGLRCVAGAEHYPSSAASLRIDVLIGQPTPVWSGRTLDCTDLRRFTRRRVVVCGDKPDDAFAAYIWMHQNEGGGKTYIELFSNEEPQGGGRGVAGRPQAALLARTLMGGDAWLIPQLNEAIATGGGGGGGEDGGRSADEQHPPTQPSPDMGTTAAAAAGAAGAATAAGVGGGDGVSGGSDQDDVQMADGELDSVAGGAVGGGRGRKRGPFDEAATPQDISQPHNSKRFAGQRLDK
ncbi:unnamed protein product [Vitrella brassicaformis CCMP3155]|uniref:Uncharacterized protein n=2 Tax=Vitrella brassicaformis TaxID=1169539 RepID=A0A0G4EQD5_VITBC|nr:unnamed protein product [Vitrella brassicaformis CCMP3155]|eukprot:CEL99676.1 unnamed protein product [Vitrella brassicaformis CCMP3155]